MKILMISPQPFFTERGTPINIRVMCQVLGNAGHQIDLIVFPTGTDVVLPNVNVIRVPNVLNVKRIPIGPSIIKLVLDCVLLMYAAVFCLTRRYDVLHGIEEGGWMAVFLGRIIRTPSIYDMDSCVTDQLQYSQFLKSSAILKIVGKLEKTILQNASLIITVCNALTKTAHSMTATPVVQIEDIALQNVTPAKKEHVKRLIRKFSFDEKKYVVYTGNLELYQGIDMLLDSWAILKQQHDIHKIAMLIIVGGGERGIQKYSETAHDKKIADSIRWVGSRPYQEMALWMEMADILVSPRQEGENTPLKIYSYMASSRPIVATNIKSHTQVLDDSVAFLAAPDPVSFGGAIVQSLTDTMLSKKKSHNAMLLSNRKYSYAVFRKKLLSAYDAVVTTSF